MTIRAIYADGVLKPLEPLQLPENQPVEIELTILPASATAPTLLFGGLSEMTMQADIGSARAILAHMGTFHFEPGELDQLLAEIVQMRALDLESYA